MAWSNENSAPQTQPSSSATLLWLLLIALASGAGVLYFLNDKLGAMAILPIGLGAAMGYRSGAWRMLSMLLGSVCGFYFAVPTSVFLIPMIESTFHRTISQPGLGVGLSGFVAGSIVTVLSLTIGWILTSRIHWLKSLDQSLGMLVGTAKSTALIAIAIWTVLAMEPRMIKLRGTNPGSEDESNSLYHRFLSIGDATRKSPCLSYLVVWNPIATNAALNDMLNKSEAMVRDIQSQTSAVQSGQLPVASKLTSMFGDLHGPQDSSNSTESTDIDGVGSLIQQFMNGQSATIK